MRDLIEKYGGGLLDETRKVKAVIPGGVSMPMLRGDQIDVAVDHESLKTRQLTARHRRCDYHGRSHLHGPRGAGSRAFLRA